MEIRRRNKIEKTLNNEILIKQKLEVIVRVLVM